MKLVFLINFISCLFSVCLTVRNVRLVDHRSYLISLIQKTMNRVEEAGWSNLKIHDIAVDMNESIFGVQYTGHLDFKNGFVVSVQSMAIVEHTIQQMWMTIGENTTSAQPQATMTMNNVLIGFDVTARVNEEDHYFTGVILYPTIQIQFLIPKNLYTGEITARVVATAISHNNRLQMLPYNHISRTIPYFFTWNSIADSVTEWSDHVFAPIAQDIARHELAFPTICYNCAVVA
ncbi:uncharacterized protein LOC121735847 [Aricia agestis]|uniref:uncharacterized protein LOC121735847 n=1 Tax=Aricia agestis TaxID=91739 RepID=UPI001C209AD5|nr:uncharacterized protein LOC121735847 [Aricia agestis]